MEASLSIVVYKGEPIDASEYRHTALFLEFSDETSTLIDVIGASGFFGVDVREDQDPAVSAELITKITVGKINGQAKDSIQSAIKDTPIKNSDRSWNCQHWVGDALTRLSDRQWITTNERAQAVNAMAGIVVDAPEHV